MNPLLRVAALGGIALCLAGGLAAGLTATPVRAESKVLVRVDGKDITEADVQMVQAEFGPEIASVPAEQRTPMLIEYLIERQLMAAAAEKQSLASGPDFEQRLALYRSKALRDLFYEKSVKGAVTEADARKIYDTEAAKEEVHARHILVKTKQEAMDLLEQIRSGDDFAELAKTKSIDTGSGAQGGDLGFFGRGQMVKPFEDAAFALAAAGDVTEPVESQFGWHIIKLEEKRTAQLPPFDEVKERIIASLMQRKAQEVSTGLRAAAKVEFVDPSLAPKAPAAGGGAPAGTSGEATPPAGGEAAPAAPSTGGTTTTP